MISTYGNVAEQSPAILQSHSRFVAVVDVLGMKAWLERAEAGSIASTLDTVIDDCKRTSAGTHGGKDYGPLIGVAAFSDTILAWSPDDSWASLSAIRSSLAMTVSVALRHGIPLRGSVAHGKVVCDPARMVFVGQPIAEAFLWSDRNRPYRSVGVDFTPRATEIILDRVTTSPPPDYANHDFPLDVLSGAQTWCDTIMWHSKSLFVNHWSNAIWLGRSPEEDFDQRGLAPSNDGVEKKEAMSAFLAVHKANAGNTTPRSDADPEGRRAAYIELGQVRIGPR